MFLALRDLSFARGRFALMGLVVTLIAFLTVLLSGLSVGLVNDGVSGLQRMPVTAFRRVVMGQGGPRGAESVGGYTWTKTTAQFPSA